MAATIEEVLWDELGIAGVSDEQKTVILNQMAETVQNRVALRLGDELTADELETFDLTMQKNGEDAAIAYLEAVYPNYGAVVMEEIERLKAEVSQDVAEIMHRAKQDEA